jgi:hypothetical protein
MDDLLHELWSAPRNNDPTMLSPYSAEWQAYRDYALARGAIEIARFMSAQARRGIAWHLPGLMPSDLKRATTRARQVSLGLRIVDGGAR